MVLGAKVPHFIKENVVPRQSVSLMIKQIKWVSCMVCKLYLSPAFEK